MQALCLPVMSISHLRKIVESAQPVIVPDTMAMPEWGKGACAVWARSYAGIPIQFMGTVVGFINLYSATAGFFTQAHTERMQTFADQIATVFANSRLVDELQKANARLHAQLSEIQALENELREQAIRDPLTGLFNRRYLQVTLDREIARVKRTKQPVGIIIMDIDRFKLINDSYGHKAGDLILEALGELLKTIAPGVETGVHLAEVEANGSQVGPAVFLFSHIVSSPQQGDRVELFGTPVLMFSALAFPPGLAR